MAKRIAYADEIIDGLMSAIITLRDRAILLRARIKNAGPTTPVDALSAELEAIEKASFLYFGAVSNEIGYSSELKSRRLQRDHVYAITKVGPDGNKISEVGWVASPDFARFLHNHAQADDHHLAYRPINFTRSLAFPRPIAPCPPPSGAILAALS